MRDKCRQFPKSKTLPWSISNPWRIPVDTIPIKSASIIVSNPNAFKPSALNASKNTYSIIKKLAWTICMSKVSKASEANVHPNSSKLLINFSVNSIFWASQKILNKCSKIVTGNLKTFGCLCMKSSIRNSAKYDKQLRTKYHKTFQL